MDAYDNNSHSIVSFSVAQGRNTKMIFRVHVYVQKLIPTKDCWRHWFVCTHLRILRIKWTSRFRHHASIMLINDRPPLFVERIFTFGSLFSPLSTDIWSIFLLPRSKQISFVVMTFQVFNHTSVSGRAAVTTKDKFQCDSEVPCSYIIFIFDSDRRRGILSIYIIQNHPSIWLRTKFQNYCVSLSMFERVISKRWKIIGRPLAPLHRTRPATVTNVEIRTCFIQNTWSAPRTQHTPLAVVPPPYKMPIFFWICHNGHYLFMYNNSNYYLTYAREHHQHAKNRCNGSSLRLNVSL